MEKKKQLQVLTSGKQVDPGVGERSKQVPRSQQSGSSLRWVIPPAKGPTKKGRGSTWGGENAPLGKIRGRKKKKVSQITSKKLRYWPWKKGRKKKEKNNSSYKH